MKNAERFTDTISAVISPEAVEIELRPAGLWVRSRAFLLDLVIRVGLAVAVFFLLLWTLPLAKGFSVGLYFIVIFLIYWLYPVLFEVFWHGQTPAKRMFGLRVVQDNGTPVSFTQSLIRNLMRTADMLPYAYGLGMSVMLLHPQFKRLGDILSGSLVIYTDEPKIKINKQVFVGVKAIRPPIALTRDERLSLILFMERLPHLSVARQQELADELLRNSDIPANESIETLKSWAKFLISDRRN
ncbi:MAG: RDD family protein [Neisseriaceae bacterium]|nr:RDD family protein [Neisseriaceae bacterium]MBQ9683499.1 RDD family protein [Neisseriaceae bacterium]